MSLKLITTETFNNLPCNFYRNTNDDILLTNATLISLMKNYMRNIMIRCLYSL